MPVVLIPICKISAVVSIGVMGVDAGGVRLIVSESMQKSWQVAMEILHRTVEPCMMHATLSTVGVTDVGALIAALLALDPRLVSLEIVTHCRPAEELQFRVVARRQVASGPPGLVRPLYVLEPNQVVLVPHATPMEERGIARPLYVLEQNQVALAPSATPVELGFARRLNVLEQSHHALVPLATIKLGFARRPQLLRLQCAPELIAQGEILKSQTRIALMLIVVLDQLSLVQTRRLFAVMIPVMALQLGSAAPQSVARSSKIRRRTTMRKAKGKSLRERSREQQLRRGVKQPRRRVKSPTRRLSGTASVTKRRARTKMKKMSAKTRGVSMRTSVRLRQVGRRRGKTELNPPTKESEKGSKTSLQSLRRSAKDG